MKYLNNMTYCIQYIYNIINMEQESKEFEALVAKILNEASDGATDNTFVIPISSGTSGRDMSMGQIMGCVGQQYYVGARAGAGPGPKKRCNKRTLPYLDFDPTHDYEHISSSMSLARMIDKVENIIA